MHKLTDDDLFWTFSPVVRGLTPGRLNELRMRDDAPGRRLIAELIDALRTKKLEVVAFNQPLPVVNDRAAYNWQFQKGLADEQAVRDVIDALCKLTDKRVTAADIVQRKLPGL